LNNVLHYQTFLLKDSKCKYYNGKIEVEIKLTRSSKVLVHKNKDIHLFFCLNMLKWLFPLSVLSFSFTQDALMAIVHSIILLTWCLIRQHIMVQQLFKAL